jgi:hypothetical protein
MGTNGGKGSLLLQEFPVKIPDFFDGFWDINFHAIDGLK